MCKGGWQKSLIFDWRIVGVSALQSLRHGFAVPPRCGEPVAALTVHRTVIHYRDCASLTLCTREALGCRVQHIFNKDAVAHSWVVYKDVGHGADEFAVLDDRAAGHG